MRTLPHPFLVLSMLLLAPSAQAAALLAEPDEDARGRVDADRTHVAAGVSVDGEEAAASMPDRPTRGLEAKVVTPVAVEVATPRREVELADGAARADAGSGNVSSRHTRWLVLEAEVEVVAAPVAVRLEADGAEVLERGAATPQPQRAATADHRGPRPAPQPAPQLAPAPTFVPALVAPDTPDAAPEPARGDAAPRASGAGRPEGAAPPPEASPVLQLLRAAALAAGAALLALLPWALYHRIAGADAARAPTRRRILDLLHERPGLGAAEAARVLALDPTTIRYHLRRLAREGLAVEHGVPARPRYFAAGSVAPAQRARHCATDARRRVLDAVAAAPGLTPTVLARGLALARPTVSWHVGRLARDGLVVVERAGREVRVRPAQG